MKVKIPLWINIFQAVLTLIMLQQVYLFTLNHQALAASGLTIEGVPNLNLLFEFAGRTATMAIASLLVIILQNPRYFLVVLFMNIVREGLETIIDPLYPLANAPMTPVNDMIAHIIIVLIELWAFIVMYKIVKRMDANEKE
tara:strand:- start:997 stop:1419 length:423 start_codon:yes stop_codon:yes gene_type:complete